MICLPRCWLSVVALIAMSVSSWSAESGYRIQASSFLGGSGDDDAVVGARVRADGAIVLAANPAGDFQAPGAAAQTGSAPPRRGAVLVLGGDGRHVAAFVRIAAEVKDLALDGEGNIYVAAAEQGAVKLSPQADRTLWTQESGGPCDRIDAAADGHCVALSGGKNVVVRCGGRKPSAAAQPAGPETETSRGALREAGKASGT